MKLRHRLALAWNAGKAAFRKASSADIAEQLEAAGSSKSGQRVTTDTALRVSTAFACARVLADGVAQVPCRLYQGEDGKRTVLGDHPAHALIALAPNAWMTAFEWRETAMLHLAFTGQHFSLKGTLGGQARELTPIPPGAVTVKRQGAAIIGYDVSLEGIQRTLSPQEVLHLRGPSWDGVVGLDVVRQAREALGLAMATEAQAATLHRNGVRPSGTYSVEGTLGPDQYDALRKVLRQYAEDDELRNAPLILDRSAKWQQHSMTSVDAQHLETRALQIMEVCRFFRVMPIMVGHADKVATYASAEQMFLAHVVHTLTPWYTRLEQSFTRQLLTLKEQTQGMRFKFTAQALMRGAARDRAEFYSRALGAGGSPAWMTQDEVRALEELPPMGGAAAMLPDRAPAQRGAPVQPTPDDGDEPRA